MLNKLKYPKTLISLTRILHLICGMGLLILIYIFATQNELNFIFVINNKVGYSIYFQIAMLNFLCWLELSWRRNDEIKTEMIILSTISMVLTLNFMASFLLIITLLQMKKTKKINMKNELIKVFKNKGVLVLYCLNITVVAVLYLTLLSIIRG